MKKTIVVASIVLSASPHLAYGWGTGNAAEPGLKPAIPVTKVTAPTASPNSADPDHAQPKEGSMNAAKLAALSYSTVIPTEGR